MEENIANDLNTIIELLREISSKLDPKPNQVLLEGIGNIPFNTTPGTYPVVVGQKPLSDPWEGIPNPKPWGDYSK